jgi:hypothetical protein
MQTGAERCCCFESLTDPTSPASYSFHSFDIVPTAIFYMYVGGETAKERAKYAMMKAQALETKKRARGLVPAALLGDKNAPASKKHDSKTCIHLGEPGCSRTSCGHQDQAAAQNVAPREALMPNGRVETRPSRFEDAFGSVACHDPARDVENKKRLENLASDMEWSVITSECKRLAAQVSVQQRPIVNSYYLSNTAGCCPGISLSKSVHTSHVSVVAACGCLPARTPVAHAGKN